MSELRPFHESIVDTINSMSAAEVPLVARLIKTTVIPKDHGAIAVAWDRRLQEVFPPSGSGDHEEVIQSLRNQLLTVEAREAAKMKKVDPAVMYKRVE